MAKTQICSAEGCEQAAAFTTRTKPAWCDEHITAMFRRAGLEPLEPFVSRRTHRLTRCLTCGCEAHYRFQLILDARNPEDPACKACIWREGAGWAWGLQHPGVTVPPPRPLEDLTHIKEKAAAAGWEYLEPLTNPPRLNDPHRVRCAHCDRIRAARAGDLGWGCDCQKNPKRELQRTKGPGGKKDLFKDSGSPAVAMWDHERNEDRWWNTATVLATRQVWWVCACGGRFREKIRLIRESSRCQECDEKQHKERAAQRELWSLTPVADVPELAEAWADEADPQLVMVSGDWRMYRFRCQGGHYPKISPERFLTAGCPHCRAKETRKSRSKRRAEDPWHGFNPEIAAQWHPTRNLPTTLAAVPLGSNKEFWWREERCGHEWKATPRQRNAQPRLLCPECRTRLDSFGYHFPELAAEWSPANPTTPWHVRPTASTLSFTPEWVCSVDPAHVWRAPLASRSAGAGCPECRTHGKSKVELAHYEAAKALYPDAASGVTVPRFDTNRRSQWHVDIAASTPSGRRLVVEYDGAYWHARKTDHDAEKTEDLIASGHLVARLREHPLPALSVRSEHYREFTVYAESPNPGEILAQVQRWANRL